MLLGLIYYLFQIQFYVWKYSEKYPALLYEIKIMVSLKKVKTYKTITIKLCKNIYKKV